MSTTFDIFKGIAVPKEAITQRWDVLGVSGSGKTHTLLLTAERFIRYGGAQVIYLDTVGVAWSLQAGADGKSAGLPITVLGGDHANVPLPNNGDAVAHMLVRTGINAVLDLSNLLPEELAHFVGAWANRFLLLRKTHKANGHIFLDEAQDLVPESPSGKGEPAMRAQLVRLLKQIRNHGFGWTLSSQDAQATWKRALNQAGNLVAHQMIASHDREFMRKWMGKSTRDPAQLALIDQLPELPTGHALLHSPSFLKLSQIVEVGPRSTFDARPPKLGEHRTTPRALAEVEVDEIRQAMADALEQAEHEDPALLRAKVARLEAELAAARKAPAAAKGAAAREVREVEKIVEKRVEVPALSAGERASLIRAGELSQEAAHAFEAVAKSIRESIDNAMAKHPGLAPRSWSPVAVAAPAAPVKALPPATIGARGTGELNAYARSLLLTFAQRHPMALNRSQLAILSGRSTRSSAFDTALAQIKRGFVEDVGDGTMRLTAAGLAAGGVPTTPRSPAELLETWRRVLPPYERALFDVLVMAYPSRLTREALADVSGKSRTSSGFDSAVSALKKNHLIVQRGAHLGASDTLFTEGRGAA